MTPDQALTILNNFQNASAADRQAVFNAIAIAAPTWAKGAFSRDQKIVALLQQLNTKVQALIIAVNTLNGGSAAPDAPDAPAGAEAAPSSGGQRFNKDGTPMSAEDMAMEDAMDAATAGLPPNQDAPAPSAMPAAAIPDGTPVETPPVVITAPPPRPRNGSASAPKA
jgi:hypothetical protein